MYLTRLDLSSLALPCTGSPNFVQPHRLLVKRGPLVKRSRNRDARYDFFLFNDLLIYASTVVGWKWKAHQMIDINDAFQVEEEDNTRGADVEKEDDDEQEEMKAGAAAAAAAKKAAAPPAAAKPITTVKMLPELKLSTARPGSSLAALQEHLSKKAVATGAGSAFVPPPLVNTPSILHAAGNRALRFVIKSSAKSFVVCAADMQDKRSWIQALKAVIHARHKARAQAYADAAAAQAAAKAADEEKVSGERPQHRSVASLAFTLGGLPPSLLSTQQSSSHLAAAVAAASQTPPSQSATAPQLNAAAAPQLPPSAVASPRSNAAAAFTSTGGSLLASSALHSSTPTSSAAAAFTSTGGTLLGLSQAAGASSASAGANAAAPPTPKAALPSPKQLSAQHARNSSNAPSASLPPALTHSSSMPRGSILHKPTPKPVLQPLSSAVRCPFCDIKFGVLMVRPHNCRRW
jgi:hypothetical protein